jgi:hypothetical protein
LVKAQANIHGAIKDSTNPHFKSKYADLSSVMEAVKAPLLAQGIAIVQATEPSEANEVRLSTMLLHASGEYIADTITVPVNKQDAQGYGSAMTYARRYGLQAMTGCCPEDDDGNAAARAAPNYDGAIADWQSSIEAASTPDELERMAPELAKAPKPVKDAVRPLYAKRKKELEA